MEDRKPNLVQQPMQDKQSQLIQSQEQNDQNQVIVKQKLFEIPDCPICLMELSSNLCAWKCGHIFHSECISKNSLYRLQCPICKVRQSSYYIPQHKVGTRLFFPLVQRQFFFYRSTQNITSSIRTLNKFQLRNYLNLQQAHKQLKLNLRLLQNQLLQKEQTLNLLQRELEKKDRIIQKSNDAQIFLQKKIRQLNHKMIDQKQQNEQMQKQIQNLQRIRQIQRNVIKDLKAQIKQQKIKSLLFVKKLQRILEKYSTTFIEQMLSQRQKNQDNYFDDISSSSQDQQDYIFQKISQFIQLQKEQILSSNTLNQQLNEKILIQSKQIKQLKSKISSFVSERKIKEVEYKLKDGEYKLKDKKHQIKDQKYQQLYSVINQTLMHRQYYKNQLLKFSQIMTFDPYKIQLQSDEQKVQNKKSNEIEEAFLVEGQKINESQQFLVFDEPDENSSRIAILIEKVSC